MASEIKVDTISEKTSAGGVTIDGLLIKDGGISGDVSLIGTTPTFTIGDAGAEDATLLFDGNAQDYYIALDDSADDLLIGLGSTVGTTPAIAIDENLKVNIPVTTASTSTSTGSLTTGGGAGIGADLYVGDDTYLITDSAVLGFGADKDTLLTHTDGTGLTLNSTNKLCFNDASQFVQGSSATVLSIGATDEIDLTATAIDINGTCDISGTFSLGGTNITTTAAEINLIDGGTARGTTALASGDGILVNDAGTMRMTNVDTVGAYIGSGHIAQVVSATRTASQSLTSTTYTAATGLTVDITPSSASSKILIFVSLGTINATDGAAEGINAKIYKDGSALTFFASNLGYNSASTSVARNFHSSFVFQNAPATTSSVTYSLYFACAGSNTIVLQTGSSVGTFTCMEILP